MGLLEALKQTADPFSNIELPAASKPPPSGNQKVDVKADNLRTQGAARARGAAMRRDSLAGRGVKRRSAASSVTDGDWSAEEDAEVEEHMAGSSDAKKQKAFADRTNDDADMLAFMNNMPAKFMDLGSELATGMGKYFATTVDMMGKQKQQIEVKRKELWQGLEEKIVQEKQHRVQELEAAKTQIQDEVKAKVTELQQTVQSSIKALDKYHQDMQRKLQAKVAAHKKLVNDGVAALTQYFELAGSALQQQAERIGNTYKANAAGHLEATAKKLKDLDARRAKMNAFQHQFAALTKQMMEEEDEE